MVTRLWLQWCTQAHLADTICEGGRDLAEWLAASWWVMDRAALESFVLAPQVALQWQLRVSP